MWLVEKKGCTPLFETLGAAAEGGQLHVCYWLVNSHRVPFGNTLLDAAAKSGSKELVQWLLGAGCRWSSSAPGAAARAGRIDFAMWLLQLMRSTQLPPEVSFHSLLDGLIHTSDLDTVQRVWNDEQQLGLSAAGEAQRSTDADYKRTAVVAAASCALPDWPDKLVWLLSRGCTESNEAYWAAARTGEGAFERVQLLRKLFVEHDRGGDLEAVLGRFRKERERAGGREGKDGFGLPAAGGPCAAAGGQGGAAAAAGPAPAAAAAAAAPAPAPPAGSTTGGTGEAMRWLVQMGLFIRHTTMWLPRTRLQLGATWRALRRYARRVTARVRRGWR